MGGTPVVLQQGESLGTLSTRYGVPVSALLAVNGLSSVNQAQPGQQIMIPPTTRFRAQGRPRLRRAEAHRQCSNRSLARDADGRRAGSSCSARRRA